MDDAKAVLLALDVAEVFLAAVRDKRIHQSIAVMAFRRVAHEARLLRDNKQVVVFVTNVERNVSRDKLGRMRVSYVSYSSTSPAQTDALLRGSLPLSAQ